MSGISGRKPPGQSVSIDDVAREAGVATSTVSRALTMPDRIAKKTRDKVLEAANRLGYTGNAAARSLRVGRSKVILLVLPGTFNAGASQVIAEMLPVIDTELVVLGYSLLIANIDRRLDAERYVLDLAFGGMTDGAIIFSSSLPEADGRTLADSGVPLVSALFDLSGQGIASVVTNDLEASQAVISHLIGLGHRSFFYVGGPLANYHEIERHKGVRRALDGRADCSLVYCRGEFDFESGTAAAETFLAAEARPTAVFCCNDDMAIAFMRRLLERGVQIPRDVSVVGFDGSSVGTYTVPSLSSVKQPTTVIGEKVVLALIGLMENNGEVPLRDVVPSTLIVRESVGEPPRQVGAALEVLEVSPEV